MADLKIYDILIIGGGITGAAVARDAAMRGFSVVLIEKGDFCSGTSSRSTKMIHGGLRYLEQFDFRLVWESLKERAIIKNIAPHQIKIVPFLLPVYKGDRFGPFKVGMGMRLYNWLCPQKKPEAYCFLKPATALQKEPYLLQKGLLGAGWYDEYILASPERFVLSIIQCARRYGAEAQNYLHVVNFIRDGNKVTGIEAVDTLNGAHYSIAAKLVVNAAGPWVDDVLRIVKPDVSPKLRVTKGIHLLVPKISECAVLFAAGKDGRLIFGIPWTDYTLIGSTDTDYKGNPDDVFVNENEVEYLLTELRRVLNHPAIDRSKIIFTYAGLRPLVLEKGKSESQISRKHKLFERDDEGGIISVAGGKLTTARLMAEQIVDIASKRIGKKTHCTTAKIPLPGGELPEQMSFEDYCADAVHKYSDHYGISEKTMKHLVHIYGTEYKKVLDLAEKIPEGKELLCSHSTAIRGQVYYAVHHEMAKTLLDVVLRRTEIGIGPALKPEECEKIADSMASCLKWDKERKKKEVEAYFVDREKRERF